ncbi:DUF6966 domain-containing protein [Microvirgula aerodenitrificans]|uniref:DUF6966 domain-containing protein n=1 Tax=Microvirgula aerodenitrificans TaxID=57480 RepID=UPI0039C9BC19
MTTHDDVGVILKKIVELLNAGAESDWAAALEKIKAEFEENPKIMSDKLLAMYGGMGSINDIILYKERRVLVAENNEFDFLRTRLYKICKEIK